MAQLRPRASHTEFFRRYTFNGRVNSCRPHWVLQVGHFQWTRQLVSATLSSLGRTPSLNAPTRVGHTEFFRQGTFNGTANSCRPHRVLQAGHLQCTRQIVSDTLSSRTETILTTNVLSLGYNRSSGEKWRHKKMKGTEHTTREAIFIPSPAIIFGIFD